MNYTVVVYFNFSLAVTQSLRQVVYLGGQPMQLLLRVIVIFADSVSIGGCSSQLSQFRVQVVHLILALLKGSAHGGDFVLFVAKANISLPNWSSICTLVRSLLREES